MAKSTKRNAFGADHPSAFRLPCLRFSVIFLTCKANARIYDAKSGHGPHSPPPGAAASPKRLKKVANLQFATWPVWARNPDGQPSKVYPSHNKSRATQAIFFGKISQALQRDFKIVSVSIFPC